MRGVPRDRRAISVMPASSASTPSSPAERLTMRDEVGGGVEVEVAGEAEPVAQRRGQQPGPGGGADDGERRERQRDRRGAGALADDDVDPEVLHREVEHLLGRARHPVDLVEEEHLALVEGGQDRRRGRRRAGSPGRW